MQKKNTNIDLMYCMFKVIQAKIVYVRLFYIVRHPGGWGWPKHDPLAAGRVGREQGGGINIPRCHS